MGSTYANILVTGSEQGEVAAYMEKIGQSSYISPTLYGHTVVWQDASRWAVDSRLLAYWISKDLQCVTWCISVFDDDAFQYELYQNGVFLDDYTSESKQGQAEKLCATYGNFSAASKVAEILVNDYLFELQRHQDLVAELGLPELVIGTDYRFIARGDLLNGIDPTQIISISNDTNNKFVNVLFVDVPDNVDFIDDIAQPVFCDGEEFGWEIGPLDAVQAAIAEALPQAIFYDPRHAYWKSDNLLVDLSIDGDPVSMVTLRFQGDGDFLEIVQHICESTGWRAANMNGSDFYHFG